MYKDYEDMEKNEIEEMLLIFNENKKLFEMHYDVALDMISDFMCAESFNESILKEYFKKYLLKPYLELKYNTKFLILGISKSGTMSAYKHYKNLYGSNKVQRTHGFGLDFSIYDEKIEEQLELQRIYNIETNILGINFFNNYSYSRNIVTLLYFQYLLKFNKKIKTIITIRCPIESSISSAYYFSEHNKPFYLQTKIDDIIL